MAAIRPLACLDDLHARVAQLPPADGAAAAAARARQDRLTKPRGALGRLEEIALWLAAWQGREPPRLERVGVLVFAGNHGVARRGVSAYPAEVTAQMVANFAAGGAAINQLARLAGAELRVVALELDQPTADLASGPAMSEGEAVAALNQGLAAVEPDLDLLALGEMGIGNTTVAAALACALLGGPPAVWAGPGTGLDAKGVARKAEVIEAALAHHGGALSDPLAILCRLGGRELAAMVGAMVGARELRIPVLLDGFVAGAAALVLHALGSDALGHAQAAHLSAEPGHRHLLERLGLRPLLALDMRLGEASGAALAITLCRAALACHLGMATFEDAGVSDRSREPPA
jgi:nicotinate-nucleotide--dimethylbenzimidazole phosphoribosyltransferase